MFPDLLDHARRSLAAKHIHEWETHGKRGRITDIVEKYETENCPMSPVSDADMLRHLIEARGITQAKLSADVHIPMSSISEVLHGKKKLTRRHIDILAKYFGVDPGAFLG